jgi:hypothetical protein
MKKFTSKLNMLIDITSTAALSFEAGGWLFLSWGGQGSLFPLPLDTLTSDFFVSAAP